MALLRVLLHGQSIGDLQMQSGQEYFAGRGAGSHIQLMAERGISRQHLKFFVEDGKWLVKLLSKYGDIIYNGQARKELQLTGTMHFTVTPYDFEFVEETVNGIAVAGTGTVGEAKAPTYEDAAPLAIEGQKTNGGDNGAREVNENLVPEKPEEKIPTGTLVAQLPSVSAFLRIVNNKTKTEEVLKLEGTLWSVGRHPKCEILLNDTAISRKHFDITRNDKNYFVTDHGSSNGTRLNGDKIPPETPTALSSGDVLTIRHIEIKFEVRDAGYDNRMLAVPATFEDVSERLVATAGLDAQLSPSAQDSHDFNLPVYGGGRVRVQRTLKSNNRIRIIIGVLICVLLYGLFSPKSTPPQVPADGKTDNASMPKILTPQQEQEATDIYNLAKNYYLQKKYVLCISQFEKLHQLVPLYKDSKQIQGYCEQGKELEQVEQDRERKEREKEEVENKIRAIVDDCRQRIANISTSVEMTNCLQGAIELDPSNIAVNDMIMQIKVKEQQAQEKQQQSETYNRRRREGEEIYARASAAFKAGDLKKAVALFSKFTTGRYPGLNSQEEHATRDITSIKKTLAEQLNAALSSCQAWLEKGDAKAAYIACAKVLHENPNDARAQALSEKAMSQLKHDMKSIYEDSVLEESLGNIDSAKEKWSRILDKDVPDDDYYRKAKSKLRKYGIGM